jgi:hypothetical protein
MEHFSLWALCEGNLEGGTLTGDPEGYVKEISGHVSIGAPLGNLEGGSFTGHFERWMRQVCRAFWGTWGGRSIYWEC